MNKRPLKFITLSLFLLANLFMLSSWGIWGHQHINKAAVFAIPAEELQTFFYNHIDFLVEESVVPDLRKYTINDRAENPRHFIDIEDFGKNIDSLPRTTKEANVAFDNKLLQSRGILPWYIQDIMEKLTKSMKEKRKTEILFLAGDLGHYIADAHMPLHTSSNHNGQLTNQKGIHALWEAQLPELLGKDYNFYTGDAKYVDNVTNETWAIIKHSHQLADTLLAADALVRKTISEDLMFQKDTSGNLIKNKFNQTVFTNDYVNALNVNMKGMVEKQLRAAIAETANFWYTAWVNAGKPDLRTLDDDGVTARNKEFLKEDLKKWKAGQLINLKTEGEF